MTPNSFRKAGQRHISVFIIDFPFDVTFPVPLPPLPLPVWLYQVASCLAQALSLPTLRCARFPCTLPSVFGDQIVGIEGANGCSPGEVLASGSSCDVACEEGYVPTAESQGQTAGFTCSDATLTSPTLKCQPGPCTLSANLGTGVWFLLQCAVAVAVAIAIAIAIAELYAALTLPLLGLPTCTIHAQRQSWHRCSRDDRTYRLCGWRTVRARSWVLRTMRNGVCPQPCLLHAFMTSFCAACRYVRSGTWNEYKCEAGNVSVPLLECLPGPCTVKLRFEIHPD